MRRCILAFVVMSLTAVTTQAEVRTWRDATGQFSIEAELAGMVGDNVTLKKSDGGTLQVPLAKLSAADREFVEAWKTERLKRGGAAPPAPTTTATAKPAAIAATATSPSVGKPAARPDAEAALNKPSPAFAFADTPLDDALRQLAEQSGVAFVLNEPSLRADGLDPKMPITGKSGGKQLYDELTGLLKPLKLYCSVDHEAVVIATETSATMDRNPIRVYRVIDPQVFDPGFRPGVAIHVQVGVGQVPPVALASPEPFNLLMEDAQKNIQPTTWVEVGGAMGSIRDFIPFRPLPAPVQVAPGVPTVSYAAAGIPVLIVTQRYDALREFEQRYAGKLLRIDRRLVKATGKAPILPAVMQALERPAHYDGSDVPLKDLLQALADEQKVKLTLNESDLNDNGINPSLPTTIGHLKGLKLSNILYHLLTPLELDYYADETGLHVQSRSATEKKQFSVSYNVQNLTAQVVQPGSDDMTILSDLITNTVAVTTWDVNGGIASKLTPNPQLGTLSVMAPFSVHRQVGDLLADMHESWNPPPARK